MVVALPAAAQMARNFPGTALRGELHVTQPPEATLDGRPVRLAPGVRIRGADNLLLLTGSVAGASLRVHYTLDPGGLVQEVWVLTPDEAARRPWPATREQAAAWRFDFASQTWSRP